jgi:extracellular factor (EF) 3-hydroxypalmitic acid methyl ester biosynthesis protein
VVSNLVNTGLLLILSATFLDPWLQESAPPAVEGADFRLEAEDFVQEWSEVNRIRDDYRLAVVSLRSYLSELSRWLQRMEAESAEAIGEIFASYDGLLDYSSHLLDKLSELNHRFELVAQRVDDQEAGLHKAFAHRELHPLIMTSPYPHRTFNKPLGYAGDYEMMNMIHREVPEGSNHYAKLVNAAYVRLPIAQAVRNRARTLEDYLHRGAQAHAGTGTPFAVLSVGCGPAIEVQRFVRGSPLTEYSRLDLLDFNEETLAYAESQVRAAMAESGHRPEVRFLKMSVHHLLKSARAIPEDGFRSSYSFIYCAGLFDYLSGKVCSRMMRLFYAWLKPGGVLLVTNMHDGTLNRYLLEHQAEWFLIYRNETQMLELIPGLGVQRTFTDETGINLCLEVRKLESAAEEGC